MKIVTTKLIERVKLNKSSTIKVYFINEEPNEKYEQEIY